MLPGRATGAEARGSSALGHRLRRGPFRLRAARTSAESAEREAEFHHQRHRAFGLRGRRQCELDVDLDLRAFRIINVAQEALGDDGDVADLLLLCVRHFPLDRGHVCGDAAVDLAIEVLDDLGPALAPPLPGGRDLRPIFADQRVGKRERLDLRLVVIGGVRCAPVHAIRALAERRDPQGLHHQPVVLLGG